MDFAVRNTHDYCMEHSMRLNPKKGKEMVVNFMGNPNTMYSCSYMYLYWENKTYKLKRSIPGEARFINLSRVNRTARQKIELLNISIDLLGV